MELARLMHYIKPRVERETRNEMANQNHEPSVSLALSVYAMEVI
jgi:hypothetical protein